MAQPNGFNPSFPGTVDALGGFTVNGEVVISGAIADQVNTVRTLGSATGDPVQLIAQGTDGNINVEITPKGSGYTVLRNGAASHVGTVVAQMFADPGDTRADAGAISIASYYTKITTTGAVAVTLPDGAVLGQLKEIHMTVDGGNATLTADLDGDTTITFADAGDRALLMWGQGTWIPVRLDNTADGVSAPVLS